MHIITRKRLLEFSEKHPDAEEPLDRWYRIVKRNDFDSFSDLRKIFPDVDLVGRLACFKSLKKYVDTVEIMRHASCVSEILYA